MQATFVELPTFEKYRAGYLSDDEYRLLQEEMLRNPEAGDVIKGTGGLRKLRFGDSRRGKGKRGGLRIIYYYWITGDAVLDVLDLQQRRDGRSNGQGT
jgi:hypothetical protein